LQGSKFTGIQGFDNGWFKACAIWLQFVRWWIACRDLCGEGPRWKFQVTMAALDPRIFQAALLEVAEATKTAAQAAQAVQKASASPSSSPTGGSAQTVDGSKLLKKPPLFEHKTTEDEIRAFRDWSWMLIQYLNAIDAGFEKELQQLMDDPTNALDLTTASAETRNRSTQLYGMLASVCRNRSSNIIRSVRNPDGYEALRQLLLALRPSTSGRGLALMVALTSWPQFTMSQPLQPLKLEDALEEARRAGTTIPDQLQQAILLKCVSGQLRTYLNLAIQDATTFKELREHVKKWDRNQQKWAGLLFSGEDSNAAAPMEIDRIHGGGKKGKDKGKRFQQKGQQKGKGKSKSKNDGKSGFKGKSKNEGKGKAGGKSYDSTSGKGKGNSRTDVCFRCGKSGRFAKDCYAWGASVRNMQHEGQQLPNPQASQSSLTPSNATAGGSPSSSGPHQQSATQFRVARIHDCDIEFQNTSDVSRHDELGFDLRNPVMSPSLSCAFMVQCVQWLKQCLMIPTCAVFCWTVVQMQTFFLRAWLDLELNLIGLLQSFRMLRGTSFPLRLCETSSCTWQTAMVSQWSSEKL
jgi:hypothetical protein